jgi:hypothetical protein
MKMRKLACRLIATPRHTMHSETEHHTMGQIEAYTCATDNGAGSKQTVLISVSYQDAIEGNKSVVACFAVEVCWKVRG